MNTYEIASTVSGAVIGHYRGATELEALDAMARDAGYDCYAAACEIAPFYDGEIILTEVPPA